MKKLIEALHVIKEECEKYNNCSYCPMGTENCECMVRDLNPCNWEINDAPQKALLWKEQA